LTRLLASYFARAAARERDARAEHYPAMVERGDLARDWAQADLAAWRAIAALFEHGRCTSGLPWSALLAAADVALERREAALAGDPQDRHLQERRDSVWGIAARLRIYQPSAAPAGATAAEAA